MPSPEHSKVVTTKVTIFDANTNGGRVTAYFIRAVSDDVLVKVHELHKTPEPEFRIPEGETQYFRVNNGGVALIEAKAMNATCTIDHGAVSLTNLSEGRA